MSLDAAALARRLCEQLCRDVAVVERPDGVLMLRTGFEFPDGDRFPIRIEEIGPGGVRLTDYGHTIMHLSYDHDVDAILKGARGVLLDQIVREGGVERDGAVFYLDTPIPRLSEAVFQFGQVLTRVHDLGLLSRSSVLSSFYEDLGVALREAVADDERVEPDYTPTGLGNGSAYSVDFRIRCESGRPLFLYGIPNRDKARLTTITLSWFHMQKLTFDSLLVFRDIKAIPPLDLERLANVGGEMLGSLAAKEDFHRKIHQRIG